MLDTILNSSKKPVFEDLPGVQMMVHLQEAGGQGKISFRLIESSLKMMDVIYTLNWKVQPPATRGALNEQHSISFPVEASTSKGSYRILGIRNSKAPNQNRWIRVDAEFMIP